MAMSQQDKERFAEIDQMVLDSKDRLRAATTHKELREFAVENNLDNRLDFGRFKASLRKISVDYNEVREQALEHEREELLNKADELESLAGELCTVNLESAAVDAGTQGGSFAVVDQEGTALWYGAFSSKFERIYTKGDLISGEQSAADKAVYLASKVARAIEHDQIALVLTTSCPDLDEDALRASGARLGVAVSVTVDRNAETALRMAESPGYRDLKSISTEELAALIEPIEWE